eukprot:7131045-Pyramimonas_sp.AAC.1
MTTTTALFLLAGRRQQKKSSGCGRSRVPLCGVGRGFARGLKKSLNGLREAALRFQELLESIA